MLTSYSDYFWQVANSLVSLIVPVFVVSFVVLIISGLFFKR